MGIQQTIFMKLPETITEKEFLENLKKVKDNKLKLAFSLGFYQCMRISEALNLKREDINLNTNFIHIKQSKGKKDRIIPIMSLIRPKLRYLPINIGKRWLQKIIKKYFGNIKFHTLRHSGATFYLNDKNIDIRFIQQLLGHSRLNTTQIYTHINPKQLQNAFTKAWEFTEKANK